MTVPHLPWTPSATQDGQVVDGSFEVDGLPHMQFRAENWKFGGCTFFAVCADCGKDAEAGGLVGKNKVIRWGFAHQCNKVENVFVDEDQKLFRK